MQPPKPTDMATEALKRQANLELEKVQDPRRNRQRALAIQTHGKYVHDIVGPFPDSNGDEVVVWVFTKDKVGSFKDGDKALVMIMNNEPARSRVVFEEVTVRNNKYYLPNGNLLAQVLRDATFDY